ncbi:hypothetical protein FHS16_004276 [Paenibacillus endophyticus]|uniref:Uncharacterized protein n=1 Tax=Paenibacillus endophyticus TaxID=1294268 RepID=A0A7W5CBG1_9BACL|nr:hypothetical protein [Paenibacillus endophyticus]MBB3154200.1 hypothetical protein [Paenibacillus endophyticus]
MVHKITVSERMDLYIDTLQRCGIYLLSADTITISYSIFEEFDVGATSFLHINNLTVLKDTGLINDLVMNKSIELRNKFMELQGSNKWSVESVKNSSEWLEILELSDEIKKCCKNNLWRITQVQPHTSVTTPCGFLLSLRLASDISVYAAATSRGAGLLLLDYIL